MIETELDHYGLQLTGVSEEVDNFPGALKVTTVTIKSTQHIGDPELKQFATDMKVMNTVRKSTDPTVLSAYEQLLTCMALTKGRDYQGVADEDAKAVAGRSKP